jgi:hypothetical protein
MDSPSGDLPVVVIGVKSYGRAPTFLPATGYEQARSVVAALADDWAAGRPTRPARTGVCSNRQGGSGTQGGSCCG